MSAEGSLGPLILCLTVLYQLLSASVNFLLQLLYFLALEFSSVEIPCHHVSFGSLNTLALPL